MKNETLFGVEDELLMNEAVGSWTEYKSSLVRLYCQLFSLGMKNKWPHRTYIDLYAGAGMSRVKGRGEILLGSPLIALSVDAPFDLYIFCEENEKKLQALRTRVARDFPTANAIFILGDCNAVASQIVAAIPSESLCLSFVDPYDLGIKFQTLSTLAARRRMDFLCLLALHMDAGRNYSHYEKESSTKVDAFIGSATWRAEWEAAKQNGTKFPRFLASTFADAMERLRYLPTESHMMKEIRTGDRNVPLYHLALFSKSLRAFDFWKKVLKAADPGNTLFDLR